MIEKATDNNDIIQSKADPLARWQKARAACVDLLPRVPPPPTTTSWGCYSFLTSSNYFFSFWDFSGGDKRRGGESYRGLLSSVSCTQQSEPSPGLWGGEVGLVSGLGEAPLQLLFPVHTTTKGLDFSPLSFLKACASPTWGERMRLVFKLHKDVWKFLL